MRMRALETYPRNPLPALGSCSKSILESHLDRDANPLLSQPRICVFLPRRATKSHRPHYPTVIRPPSFYPSSLPLTPPNSCPKRRAAPRSVRFLFECPLRPKRPPG